jgi:hypothetical protein
VVVNDCNIFGEIEIPDCPVPGNGDYCSAYTKYALFPSTAAVKGKDPHITMASGLPMYKIKANAAWGARAVWNRNKFTGFNTLTREGSR